MVLKVGRMVLPLGVFLMVGCAQPIKWSIQPTVSPDPVKIGKEFKATCKMTGELEKIGWVSAVPIVAPEYTLELKDDGKEADEKAGDGIFSAKATPPDEAEPGLYEIEFVVYDKNGDPVEVPCFTHYDKEGKVVKEIAPKEEDGKKPAGVEFSEIITINLE